MVRGERPHRVGVLGGTFDPIHLGHLIIAEEARSRLDLESVIFVPAKNQWRKQGRTLSPPADRMEMVRMAIAGNPFFRVSAVDLDREGVTYTADTLEELSGDHELYFILGMDALTDLPHWRRPEEIVKLAWLVVAARGGIAPDVAAIEEALPGARSRVIPLRIPEIGISSTAIRARVAGSESIRYWVPDGVREYIQSSRLYTRG